MTRRRLSEASSSMSGIHRLVSEVAELTARKWTGHWVALYVYGSFARDENDPWSDLDILLVRRAGEGGLAAGRQWMAEIYARFNYLVDPLLLPEEELTDRTHWANASFVQGLKRDGVVLFGDDIRPRMAEPTEGQLRICTLQLAMLAVRRLLGLSREVPAPEVLAALDVHRIKRCPAGNAAWQVTTCAAAMLRALSMLQTGRPRQDKRSIAEDLRAAGRDDLASLPEEAVRIRAAVPRWGELGAGFVPVQRLASALGDLYGQLIRS